MRAYTVATVAVALNVKAKWIDNVLSHQEIPGVSRKCQGVSRRLTPDAVTVLQIVLLISRSLGTSTSRALEIACELTSSGGPAARYPLDGKGDLTIDVASLEADLAGRLALATEVAPSPRRGRPPHRR